MKEQTQEEKKSAAEKNVKPAGPDEAHFKMALSNAEKAHEAAMNRFVSRNS